VFVAAVLAACALCAIAAAPPEVRAFEADVVVESSIMPVSYKGHCYWDMDQEKYRLDTSMFGAKNIEINDFKNAVRYIIESGWGQDSCKVCFLDGDMNPMTVPPIAFPDGTDVVNGETCDLWRLKFPMVDWSFCTQQHAPFAILRTVMDIFSVKNTMTFSNILAYHPPAGVFEPNSTMCKPPKCQATVDIALLIDGSGSISSSDFRLMKEFATLVTRNVTISAQTANMAIVQFSSQSRVEIGLSDDANAITTAISSMVQMNSGTNMDSGLDTAYATLKKSTRSTSKVLIMFTDGEPDRGNNPVAHAKTIKDAGVEIYTVGVGSGVNPKILKDIASDDKNPLQPHYIQADSFTKLVELLSNIVAAMCKDDTCSSKN